MEQTTPNGTKYNLRQRERRNLSNSFMSSGSDSPPPTTAADHHHRSRNHSSSKKNPHVSQQVKGRPSIHRPSAFDVVPHFSEGPQTIISGNVPPPQSFISGTVPACKNGNISPGCLASAGRGQSSVTRAVEKPEGFIEREADTTDVKTIVENGNSSLDVNAPDSLAARSMLTKSTDSPSSQSSAKFLEAASFYGSALNRPPSPRMGTKLCQRSPLFPSSTQPSVSLGTSALPTVSTSTQSKIQPDVSIGITTSTAPIATTMKTIPKTTLATSQEQIANGPPTTPPGRSVLSGPRSGDFSDDDLASETRPRRVSPNQRSGNDVPVAILPQQRRPSGEQTPQGLVIFFIFVSFWMVGSVYQYLLGEVSDEINVVKPVVREATEPAEEQSEPALPSLPLVELESRIEGILKEQQKDVDDLREFLNTALKDGEVRAKEAIFRERLLSDSLRSLTDSTKEMESTQRLFGDEMRNYKLEMNRLGKTQVENDATVKDVKGFATRLEEIVLGIEEKVDELENSVKASVLKQVTEVHSLKALMHVSRSPPAVNETEILEKERLQERMRESIGADLMDVFGRKFDEINVGLKREVDRVKDEFSRKESQLKQHLENIVAERVAAIIPLLEDRDRLGEEAVKRLIETALKKNKDSDEAVDYALESQGGFVVDESTSDTYTASPSTLSLFGVPLWYRVNGPRTIIGADKHPGQCWPMAGSSGHVLIKLSHDILLTGFSLEHIAKRSSPTNSISSAPKDFRVQIPGESGSVYLGPFRYDENSTRTIQHFDLDPRERLRASYVKLNVDSNYGHPDYTCIYRFRVHGVYTGG